MGANERVREQETKEEERKTGPRLSHLVGRAPSKPSSFLYLKNICRYMRREVVALHRELYRWQVKGLPKCPEDIVDIVNSGRNQPPTEKYHETKLKTIGKHQNNQLQTR